MFDRQRGGRKPLTRVLIYSTVHGMVGFVLFARLFFVLSFYFFENLRRLNDVFMFVRRVVSVSVRRLNITELSLR